jgi:hypothetical protein
MLLQELFKNDTTNWKWGFRGSQEAEAKFVVGEVEYQFYAYMEAPYHGDWEVEFRVIHGVDPRNRYGVTGTGNAAHVMAVVVEILGEFLQQYDDKIKSLTFSAKEMSRRDLYARMVRRLLPTWDFKLEKQQFFLTRPEKINETAEEDRAIISLASVIYNKITPYIDSDGDELVRIGKISDIADTPLHAVDDVSVELLGGDEFIERAKEPDEDIEMYSGKEFLAFYEEDTRTIVLNRDFLGLHRMKTSITHELRHALDEIKSGSFPGNANRYFTPKKKEHRKDDPYSTLQYRARPAEINARFVEILDILSKRIPKWYDKLDAGSIKKQLSTDFKNLLNKYEIADIFPEKTQSPDYKRLVKRAYDFMQKEMAHVESELAKNGTPKKATGSF